MNNQIEVAASTLRESITDFLVPLQTTRIIKTDAFEKIRGSARELMRLLKGQPVVSKSLLNEIFVTSLVIRAEAPYFGSERQRLEEMGSELELCLSLILKDEAPEDRIPGVPRIM